MLKALFYARFHPIRGPSVIHQYPNGCIIPAVGDELKHGSCTRLLNFQDVSGCVIPPYEVCDRPFSITTSGHRVLGFPISPEDAKYERNRFTYNVCFVLEENEDVRPWQQVVRKVAHFFRAMEEQDGILQTEEELEGLRWAGEQDYPSREVGVVYTLLESIFKDLNAYGECCIRIDELHVLNLRLSEHRDPPPKVRAWEVPLVIRALPSPEKWTWDLTLRRISPHMNGVNHVQKIADLADVEPKLVTKCVRELLYHERVILLDIFHFEAIYAPTADITWFIKDTEMQDECRRYVAVKPGDSFFASKQPILANAYDQSALSSRALVIELYTALRPGLPLSGYCLARQSQLVSIDIRRLITFGIIKGFLRRVHKYAIAMHPSSPEPTTMDQTSPKKSKGDAVRKFDDGWKKRALSSGWATPPVEIPLSLCNSTPKVQATTGEAEDERLRAYLDGKHCIDEVCCGLHMSERQLEQKLRGGHFGGVLFFNR